MRAIATTIFVALVPLASARADSLKLVHTIADDDNRPKSVVSNQHGYFFVQNIHYRHTVTVYNRQFQRIATLSDRVSLSDLGYKKYPGLYKGAPVEAAFDSSGNWAWVTNYTMEGDGFRTPGHDKCEASDVFDHSFVYQIDTQALKITNAIPVGSVPKQVKVSPDDRWLLVANWCDGTLSIIDLQSRIHTRAVKVGRHPRGIAIGPDSKRAYVTLMGESQVVSIDVLNGEVVSRISVGPTPRDVLVNSNGDELFVSLSEPGEVVRVDLTNNSVAARLKSGDKTRGLALSPDGRFLYAANYGDNSLIKVATKSLERLERINTGNQPISLSFDADSGQLWLACYSGQIMIFRDHAYEPAAPKPLRPLYRGPEGPEHHSDLDLKWDSVELRSPSKRSSSKPRSSPRKKSQDKKEATRTPPRGAYVIVASFSLLLYAERFATRLLDDGYDAGIVTVDGERHRVFAARYSTWKEARSKVHHYQRAIDAKAWIYLVR